MGRELYALTCERIGAQALREDVTAASYRNLCRPLRWEGAKPVYAESVDEELLPALHEGAVDTQGNVVPLTKQQADRDYAIARIETLARSRDAVIEAFDFMLPDVSLPSFSLDATDCSSSTSKVRLLDALPDAMAGVVDLQLDSNVLEEITGALAEATAAVRDDEAASSALSRLATRVGYRPSELALGLARPLADYPRWLELSRTVLPLVADGQDGSARAALDVARAALASELREAPSEPEAPLEISANAAAMREQLSRPRNALELARATLLRDDGVNADRKPVQVVERDPRGVVRVLDRHGVLPFPFVPDEHELPQLDELGRFITMLSGPVALPFAQIDREDTAQRDAEGHALGDDGKPLYAYRDAARTFLNPLLRDTRALLRRDGSGESPLFDALAVLPTVLGGGASRVQRTLAQAQGKPLAYAGFDAQRSPVIDLAYAAGQALALPEVDAVGQLVQRLLEQHPDLVVDAIGLAFELDAIADRHPEASIPRDSTFWDEVLDQAVTLSRVPGLLEDVMRSLAVAETATLDDVLPGLLLHKDQYTYFHDTANPANYDALNGPPFDLSTGEVGPPSVLVNRSAPDTGENRSIMQRVLHLLHDTLGLQVCTKPGAVAHVSIEFPTGSGSFVGFDYPTDPLSGVVCAAFGQQAPEKLDPCGLMRIDISNIVVDSFLGKATVQLSDPCLNALTQSAVSQATGLGDTLLEAISGIRGFGQHPTPQGVARLAFFDAGYDGFGGAEGDPTYPLTGRFVRGVIEPVPSMVCPETPFADPLSGTTIPLRTCERFEDTLRGRHPGGLLLLETVPFYDAVKPLAAAFDAHDADRQMLDLLDVLHRHWGSSSQSRDECDPTAKRSDARFCNQTGLVRYEPLVAAFGSEAHMMARLGKLVRALADVRVNVCSGDDGCATTVQRDGIEVLGAAARALVDPERSVGLVDLRGTRTALRNDGTTNPQVTPVYLLTQALAELDRAYDDAAKTNPDDATLEQGWLSARSRILDTLFAVEKKDGKLSFVNQAFAASLPTFTRVLRSQLAALCPELARGERCAWASQTLPRRAAELLEHPLTSSAVDVLDTLRRDEGAHREIHALLDYLLDTASSTDAHAALLSVAVDLLQDTPLDQTLAPFRGLVAELIWPSAGQGRGIVPAGIDLLSAIAAPAPGSCASRIDPQRTFEFVMRRSVARMPTTGRAPIEVMLDLLWAINRKAPGTAGDLAGPDYRNVAREVTEFLIDDESGLEQVYALLRQLTGHDK